MRRLLCLGLALGLGLLGVLVLDSQSYVFSAMTFGLLVLAGEAARARRKA